MVLAEGLYRFEQAMDFPVTRVETSWAGLRSFAPDRTPVAGFDRTAEGFFWLAGQGGYGIQTSPALSRLAGQLIRRASIAGDLAGLAPRFRRTVSATEFQTRSFITGGKPMTVRRIEAGPRMTQAVSTATPSISPARSAPATTSPSRPGIFWRRSTGC